MPRAIGVRIANVIGHAPYHGVQLHPRDCRAAFIEFNHTDGSDDILGPYPPAGPDWQKSIAKDVTQALTGVEMQSPDPQGAGRALGTDHRDSASARVPSGEPELKLPNCSFRFVEGDSEIMSGLISGSAMSQPSAMPPRPEDIRCRAASSCSAA